MKEPLKTFCRRSQTLSMSFGFQWAALMMLLTRTVWGMWNWRDLTYGDTSSYYRYFSTNYAGAESISLVFSPLYIVFYSWFGAWFENAHAATILHRIAILVLISSSLLLLARLLLPKAIAWLVVAWWVVLPINWNALYEVHLFGFLCFALGCWAMGLRARLWACSLGLAFIWCGTLLVRNEYALTVALLTLCCVIREFFVWKKSRGGVTQLLGQIVLLSLFSLLVTAASIFAFRDKWRGYNDIQANFKERHNLNMAQVYPFSYQQRHPEWTKSPWTEGGQLMQEHFGSSSLPLSQAYLRNPQAVTDNVLWHLRLLPAGLQMGLFNCHYGAHSPDFTPPRQNPMRAALLSTATIILILIGGACLWRSRHFFYRLYHSRRGWCWLALLCTLPPCVVAIISQRPRPSYIFPLSFFLMALCGLCLYAVLRQCKLWRHFKSIFPWCVLVIIVASAPEKTTAQIYTGQPLLQIYQRILPFRAYFQGKKMVFASREFPSELDNYLRSTRHDVAPLNLGTLSVKSATDFTDLLEKNRVSALYLDAVDLNHPPVMEWLQSTHIKSWKILAQHEQNPEHWMLLASNSYSAVDHRPVREWPSQSRKIEFGTQSKNIGTVKTAGIDSDGWFAGKASFIVPANPMSAVELEVEYPGQPTANSPGNSLTIYYCGEQIVSSEVLSGRKKFKILWREGQENRIELEAGTLFTLPPPDGRQRSMRIVRIKFVP